MSRTRTKWLERFSIHVRKPLPSASRMAASSENRSEPLAWTPREVSFSIDLAHPSDLAEPLLGTILFRGHCRALRLAPPEPFAWTRPRDFSVEQLCSGGHSMVQARDAHRGEEHDSRRGLVHDPDLPPAALEDVADNARWPAGADCGGANCGALRCISICG